MLGALVALLVGCGEANNQRQQPPRPMMPVQPPITQQPLPLDHPQHALNRPQNKPALPVAPPFDAALRWQVQVDPPSTPLNVPGKESLNTLYPRTLPEPATTVTFSTTPAPLALVKYARPNYTEVIHLLTGKVTGSGHLSDRKYNREAVSPNGQMIAQTYGEPGNFGIVITSLGNEGIGVDSSGKLPSEYGQVGFVQFASDRRVVAIARGEKRTAAIVHDVDEEKYFRLKPRFDLFANSPEETTAAADMAACSPGGKYLAAVLQTVSQAQIVLYDLDSAQRAGVLEMEPVAAGWRAQGLAFSHDGKQLAALSTNQHQLRILIWDMASGSRKGMATHTLEANSTLPSAQQPQLQPVSPQADAPQGGWAVSGRYFLPSEGSDLTPLFPAEHDTHERLTIGPQMVIGTKYSSGSPTSLVALSNLPPPATLARVEPRDVTPPAAATPIAGQPAVKNDDFPLTPPSEWKSIIDPSAQAAFTPTRKLSHSFERRTSFYPSQHGKGLITRDQQGEVRVFDLSTGKQVGQPFANDKRNEILAVDLGVERIAYIPRDSGRDERVEVRTLQDGKVESISIDDFDDVRFLGFSSAGSLIVVQEKLSDHIVRIYARGQAKPEHTLRVLALPNTPDQPAHVAISPGGKYLAVQAHRGVSIIDLEAGKVIQRAAVPFHWQPAEHSEVDHALRFSPHGRYLAALLAFGQENTYGYFNKLVIWNMETGEALLSRTYREAWRRQARSEDSGRSLLAWAGNDLLVAYGTLVIDRQSGTPFFRLPQEPNWLVQPLSDAQGLVYDDEEVVSAVPLPTQELSAAVAAVRQAASENQPKLALTAGAAVPPLVPFQAPATGSLTADSVASAEPQLGPVKLTEQFGRPSGLCIGGPARGLAIVEMEDLPEHYAQPVNDLWKQQGHPLRPERGAAIDIYDLAQNKLLHHLKIPGKSRLLDVSADGSLVLTGQGEGRFPGDKGYTRLDIWGPQIGKSHVLSWETVSRTSPVTASTEGARFVDKRHVLTWDGNEAALWRLPAGEMVYRRVCEGSPLVSPSRKYWLDPSQRVMYDSLSGQALVQLESPFANSGMLGEIRFSTAGDQLICWAKHQAGDAIIRWGLDGKIRDRLPLSMPQARSFCWPLGQRGLLFEQPVNGQNGFLLYDLELQQIAGIYSAGPTSDFHVSQPDGTFWRSERIVKLSQEQPNVATGGVYLQGFTDRDFNFPAQGLKSMFIAQRGSKMSAQVLGEVGQPNEVGQALVEKLTASGFTYDPNAELLLTFELRRIVPAEERLKVLRILTPILTINDRAGTVYWRNMERMERPLDFQFDAVEYVKKPALPGLIYNMPLKNELDKTTLPPIKPK
ncbi:WD40 repeat domain-containing protein [Anatilimnocola aggregata]|nr:WD40 repeat domain-containing protein [Anatilimnocola aggregata]